MPSETRARLSLKSSKLKGPSRTWRQGDPFPTISNTKPPENKRKILRASINGEEQLCCPDSGSSKNIMSKAFANEQKLEIHQQHRDIKRFQMGSGKYVSSMGRVSVRVEVPGTPLRQRKRSFYVLEDCPVQTVLGMPFLEEAEIQTKNRHLLEPCPADWSNISQFPWIGTPRNRMNCSIDGHDFVAVADTGSDLNFMSLDCARKGGFHIDSRSQVRRRVQVGDGTEVKTVGRVYIYNLEFDWRKPETCPEDTVSAGFSTASSEADENTSSFDEKVTIFDIIEGLPSDIVFGQELLETLDAFNHCPDLLKPGGNHCITQGFKAHEFNAFIDRGPILSLRSFWWRRRKDTVVTTQTKEQHDEMRWAEYRRRAQDDRISSLSRSGQIGARETEQGKYASGMSFIRVVRTAASPSTMCDWVPRG